MSALPVDELNFFPFKVIMDAVTGVARQIGQERLIVYRWRPNALQLENGKGSLYHTLGETPHTPADIYHEEDNLVINARLAVKKTDVPDEMGLLEVLASEYISRIDPALKRIRPLGAFQIKKAWRVSMRMVNDEFDGVDPLILEFPLVFTIHRQVIPNQ